MSKPRLLIADDHSLVLEGLRRILEEEYEIVAAARDGREAVAEAVRLQPDLLVLDVWMPELNGIEAARQVLSKLPGAKVVFITRATDREYARAGFRAGARGYVVKQSAPGELVAALREAAAGRFYVSECLRMGFPELAELHGRPETHVRGTLTLRQREVLQLVAEGKSAKEIAEALGISPKTVEFHKSGIMNELGLRTTAELTRFAIAHGIVHR